jgi:hypothetical protein
MIGEKEVAEGDICWNERYFDAVHFLTLYEEEEPYA